MSAYTRSRKRFLQGLGVYLSILFFLFGVALILLWVFLANHQRDVDEEALRQAEAEERLAQEQAELRAPQLAFERFLDSSSAEDWAERWFQVNPASLDDPERVEALMEELFKGEDFRCWKAPEYSDEAPAYILKNNGRELALVTLSGSGAAWHVSEIEMRIIAEEEASLKVPSDCTVSCNGHPLDSFYCVTEDAPFEMEEYEDDLLSPLRYSTYTVTDQLFPPVLEAAPPASRTVIPAEDGTYAYVLPADKAAPYQQQAERFVHTLVYYIMLGSNNTDAHMRSVLNLVPYGSQAYELVLGTYQGVIWDTPYYNAVFSEKAGDAVIRADNCFTIDVAYHAEGSAGGYSNAADGVYRLFFIDYGGGYAIYGLRYG